VSEAPHRDRPSWARYLVLLLAAAGVIGLSVALSRGDGSVVAEEGAPSAQEIMSLDLQGKMRVYGSHVPAMQGAAFGSPLGSTEEPGPTEKRNPRLAVRLAALELLDDDPDDARGLLLGAEGDERLAELAAGVGAEPDAPLMDEAVDASTRVQPLWARRAIRLHLLEQAGEDEALAREEGLIASEAAETLIGPVVVGVGFMVALGIGIMVWLIGAPGLVIWWLTRRYSQPAEPEAQPYAYPRPEALPATDAAPEAPAADEVADDTEPDRGPTLLTAGEVLVAFFGAQLLAGFGYRALSPSAASAPYALFVIYLTASAAAWAVARWRLGPDALAEMGFRSCPAWKLYAYPLLGLAALLPLYLLVAFVVSQFAEAPPQSTNPALGLMAGQDSWLGRIVMFVTVAVAAPLAEEAMFRGVLYDSLRPRIGVIGAIIGSSAVFGLVHLDPMVTPQLILVGIAAAILRELSDSIWPSVILHGLGNGAVTVLVFLLSA
jgi:membrane protease YdiL (CAAX protease family)